MNRISSSAVFTLVIALIGALVASGPINAQTAPAPAVALSASAQPASGTTLRDLVAELERQNPEMAAARRFVDASVAAIAPAGALPDPTLSGGYMAGVKAFPFFPTTNPSDSFRQFGASQEFPYPGKLSLRTKIAVSESDAQRWTYETARRRLVADLKSAYYEYVFVDRSLEVLARNKARLDQFRQIADARYSVGKAMQQDVLKAQLEISLLIERQAVLSQQRAALRAQINALLYRRPDTPLDVSLNYEPASLTRSLDELQALAAQNNPELKRDERMVDRGQQALALAKREMLPDFAVNVTTQQMVGDMPWMYGVDFMVKVPLYWQRKQRPLIAQAAAQLEGGRKMRENTLALAAAQITNTYAMADTSHRLVTLYGDSVLPQARLALESSLASYQVGGVDFLTVLTNFITVLNYEINYEEQNARFHEALARLEPLVGVALTN
jgi:cobalt-zinc-cadmium efflux system outer membrane protein